MGMKKLAFILSFAIAGLSFGAGPAQPGARPQPAQPQVRSVQPQFQTPHNYVQQMPDRHEERHEKHRWEHRPYIFPNYGYGYTPFYGGYGYGYGWNLNPWWVDSGDNGQNQQPPVQQQPPVPNPPVAPPQPTPAEIAAQAQNAVDHSPLMIAANNSVTVAQTAFDAQRLRVLTALKQNPDYIKAVGKRDEAYKSVTTQPTAAVIEAKLDLGSEVTVMEETAVTNDVGTAVAKARLQQAVFDRDILKSQLLAQFMSNR